jgi:single-stranded DNA-specific DHH superfamily exonuclease
MIENNPELKIRNSTVIYNRDWHKGVVGIVASSLTEFYYRPYNSSYGIKRTGNWFGQIGEGF